MAFHREGFPARVLSFDPGGSENSWGYTLSTLKKRSKKLLYVPLEIGLVPCLPKGSLNRPDFTPLTKWLDALLARQPSIEICGGSYAPRMDLVAERFMGRGFSSWTAEFIPLSLGFWASEWQRRGLGQVNLIMAATWKRKLKGLCEEDSGFTSFSGPLWDKDLDMENSRWQEWWEEWYSPYLTLEQTKKLERHLADSAAIGFWYWRWALGLPCFPDGLHPRQRRGTCK